MASLAAASAFGAILSVFFVISFNLFKNEKDTTKRNKEKHHWQID
jgi:amino acid permease